MQLAIKPAAPVISMLESFVKRKFVKLKRGSRAKVIHFDQYEKLAVPIVGWFELFN